MNVMLLAAGEGTRLRPFTLTKPKPAIPFLNIPLAAHVLRFLGDTKINKLVVNTFHLGGEIHKVFESLPHGAKSLHFSDEVGEILGSGGGLGKAREHFIGGGSFLMMNADEVILPADLKAIETALKKHQRTSALATLLVTRHPGVGTQFGGVWADDQGVVKGFGKSAPSEGCYGWHFIGVQILSEKVFDYIPRDVPSNILYDVLVKGMAEGHQVEVAPMECHWFETGNLHDFLSASKKCVEILGGPSNVATQSLEIGFQRFLNSKSCLTQKNGASVLYSSEAQVANNVIFEGTVCLGSGSRVEENCRLKNVIVGSGVVVPSGTTAEDTILL